MLQKSIALNLPQLNLKNPFTLKNLTSPKNNKSVSKNILVS